MADINAVAKQFTDFYFTTFDTNRGGLQSLYVRPQAVCASPYPLDLTAPLFSFVARCVYADLGGHTYPRRGCYFGEVGRKSRLFLLHKQWDLIGVFQSLPFEKVQHKITTLDAQPSSPGVASMIVSVTGLLMVSGPIFHVRSDAKRAVLLLYATRSTTARTPSSSARSSS